MERSSSTTGSRVFRRYSGFVKVARLPGITSGAAYFKLSVVHIYRWLSVFVWHMATLICTRSLWFASGRLLTLKGLNRLAVLLVIIVPLALSSITPSAANSDDALTQALNTATSGSDPLSDGSVKVHSDGEVEIEVEGARGESTYVLRFAGSTGTPANVQLGDFHTDSEGHGSAGFELSPGTYVGIFEVLREGIVQYLTLQASFVVVTETTTTTSSSTTESSTSTQTTNQLLTVEVEPHAREVPAGGLAEFRVHVRAGRVEERIFLSIAGVPDGATAIFSPPFNREPKSEFHSKLLVATGFAAAGTYPLTIYAVADEHRAAASASLIIVGAQNNTVAAEHKLHLRLATDKPKYPSGESVLLLGTVTEQSHNAVGGVQVSVQIVDEAGASVFVGQFETDAAGTFTSHVTLPPTAPQGIYTVFGVAAKVGFEDDRARTTFVVGTTGSPSITIRQIRITGQNGTEQALFRPGDTLVVWVVVENSGAVLPRAMIWVQVRDPNGVPISITINVELNFQGIKEIAVFISLSSNAVAGTYSVNAFVSDNLISMGGKFLASAQAQFAVGA